MRRLIINGLLSDMRRLANPGITAKGIIEMQSGNRLDQDDVVSFEDTYNKN